MDWSSAPPALRLEHRAPAHCLTGACHSSFEPFESHSCRRAKRRPSRGAPRRRGQARPSPAVRHCLPRVPAGESAACIHLTQGSAAGTRWSVVPGETRGRAAAAVDKFDGVLLRMNLTRCVGAVRFATRFELPHCHKLIVIPGRKIGHKHNSVIS